MSHLKLEIWFEQQNEVTVFLESTVGDPDEEQFYETSLFSLYAARQMANLSGDIVSQSLAGVLLTLDEDDLLADVEARLDDVRVSSPIGSQGGRKGFTAELRPEKRGFFKLHAHGFGMLGKGVGYYSPTSTLALLCWLLRRRKDDQAFHRALGAASRYIGLAGTNGMIGVASQAQIAMEATSAAWSEAMEAATLPEGFELSPEAAAAADAADINFAALYEGASSRLADAIEEMGTDDGSAVIFPDEVCKRMSRVEVALAADLLAEDTSLATAFDALQGAEATGDDAMIAAAEAHYDRQLSEALDDHDLTPLADELESLLFTADAEEAGFQ